MFQKINRDELYIVYKYTHENGSYIGITRKSKEKRRKWEHKYDANKGSKFSFHSAIRKHGFDSLEYTVLCTCFSYKDACDMEKYLIKEYDTFNNGYNMTCGGDGLGASVNHPCYGKKLSKEHRQKLSISHKNRGSHYKNHPMEYYETNAIRRDIFIDICKRRNWDFLEFEEIDSGDRYSNKSIKYYYKYTGTKREFYKKGTKEYYKIHAVTKGLFKRACKINKWDFEDFDIISTGTRNKQNTELFFFIQKTINNK